MAARSRRSSAQAPIPAKLTRPRLSGAIARERLFEQLDRLRERSMIWIEGPPGAGKTTLVASWLQARALASIWYQADADDADIGTFCHFLALAIDLGGRGPRHALPVLAVEYRREPDRFLRRFFRELYDRMPQPTILVIDDYHEVGSSLALHAALAVALQEAPAAVTLVVLSRRSPPKALARFALGTALARMDWEDLRFTADEAEQLLGGAAAAGAGGERERRAMRDLAGGWAAGLMLLRERGSGSLAAAGPAAASRDMLFNYFAGQVFDRLAPRTQRLLTKIAVLPRLTAAVAQQLTGDADATALLEALHRRGLFVDRHAGDPVTYQLHALFRAFLLARAQPRGVTEEWITEASAAAALLDSQGEVADAFAVYRQAGDDAAMLRIILREAPALLRQGRRETLLSWIAQLPAKLAQDEPWLRYWTGAARIFIDDADAQRQFDAAHAEFERRGDRVGQLLAASGAVEAIHAAASDYSGLDRWAGRVQALYAEAVALPSEHAELRAAVGVLISSYLKPSDAAVLEAGARAVMSLLRSGLDVEQKVWAAAFLLEHFITESKADDVQRLLGIVGPMLRQPGLSRVTLARWLVISGFALVYGYGSDPRAFDEGIAAWRRARTIAEEEGLAPIAFRAIQEEALVRANRGDVAAATGLLEDARLHLDAGRSMDVASHSHLEARLLLTQARAPEALARAQRAVSIAHGASYPENHLAPLLVTEAYCHLSLRQGDAAVACIERALAGADGRQREERASLLTFVRAYAALLDDDHGAANAQLRQAWPAARRLQWFAFRPVPQVASRLCDAGLALGLESDYVARIIEARSLAPPASASSHWPWPLKILALGRFTVLRRQLPLEFTRKTQKRPLDLLKCLMACGGREVDGARLADLLWPDAEGDAARHAFDVTLGRLRQLLGDPEALLLQEGKLSLDAQRVWVDVWALEERFARLRPSAAQADPAPRTREVADEILDLYRGHFLQDEPAHSWAMPMRDRLRSGFLRCVLSIGQACESAGQWSEAIELYRRGLEQDNLGEGLYRQLMICHRARGELAEAINVYRRCRDMLAAVLGVAPAPETQAIYRDLRG